MSMLTSLQGTTNTRYQYTPISNNCVDICVFLQQTESVSPVNERRQFISGFTGTSGTAVVTANKAVLWTDGRYYLQADQQLDCHWILMKSGQPQVPYTNFSLF